MDRALIERLIGAVVLVLLLVIVAPALLDGRKPEGPGKELTRIDTDELRTEVIVLNAPLDAAAEPDVPPAPEAPGQPEELIPEPVAPAPVARTTPPPEPAPVAKPVPQAKPAVVAKSGAPEGFAVQLGSFAQRDNAEKYALAVRREGFEVFVARAAASSGSVYRVYAGPRASRAEAEQLASGLAARGRSGLVIDLSN